MFIQTINLENCKNVNRLYQKKFKISRGVLDNWDLPILGDPGADKGGEGKSKQAEKYIRNEKK